jgi:hypothetical protein
MKLSFSWIRIKTSFLMRETHIARENKHFKSDMVFLKNLVDQIHLSGIEKDNHFQIEKGRYVSIVIRSFFKNA